MANRDSMLNEWLEFANRDLESAAFLLKMRPTPNEIICYHCQQSAEKYLKAYLLSKDEEIKKTHDLQFLCKLCAAHNTMFTEIEDACIDLTEYGVQARYPFHIDIEQEDVTLAIDNAYVIKNFINSLLSN